jgi:hypothetical protein
MFGSNDGNQAPGAVPMPPNDHNPAAYNNPASHPVTPISSNIDTPLTNTPPLSQPAAPHMPDLNLPPGLPMHEVPSPYQAPHQAMPSAAPHAPPADDNLLHLKQQAIRNLEPLVTHLEQTPEEKFKTTMMLIQASDNPALVKDAYEAAQKITDEKARAQALIDVVNEINYFTQHKK